MDKAKVFSLGAGVQSTTLALKAEAGEIERPDFMVFADTQWEPASVYGHLWKLAEAVSIPVFIATAGNLREALVDHAQGRAKRVAAIPAFTLTESGPGFLKRGRGMRQCTNDYKLVPINREIRKQLGYGPRSYIPPDRVEVSIGISTDEASRMKPSKLKWQRHVFPLLDLGLSRKDCLTYLAVCGWGDTPKSSCLGCPFHSDAAWLQMKTRDPVGFAETVELDAIIRAPVGKIRSERFLHRECIPLGEVDLDPHRDQIDMFDNECTGYCGV